MVATGEPTAPAYTAVAHARVPRLLLLLIRWPRPTCSSPSTLCGATWAISGRWSGACGTSGAGRGPAPTASPSLMTTGGRRGAFASAGLLLTEVLQLRLLVLDVGPLIGGGLLAGTHAAIRAIHPVFFAGLQSALVSSQPLTAAKDQVMTLTRPHSRVARKLTRVRQLIYKEIAATRPALLHVMHRPDEWFYLGSNLLCSWCTPMPTEDSWDLVHRFSAACALGCSVVYSMALVLAAPAGLWLLFRRGQPRDLHPRTRTV